MRVFVVFQCLIIILGFSVPLSFAHADMSGSMQWQEYIWGPPNTDPVRPYLRTAKVPHNSQWADDEWSPQDWIDDRGSAEAVIDGFYAAEIITDQYDEGDTPVLEVGQRFLDLSPQEKRRVVSFFDDVFGITSGTPNGVMLIYFHNDEEHVGVFNKDGLQLQ